MIDSCCRVRRRLGGAVDAAVGIEVERGCENFIGAVVRGIRKTVGIGKVAGQRVADRRFRNEIRIDAIGADGDVVKARIRQQVIDRCDVADVRLVIRRLGCGGISGVDLSLGIEVDRVVFVGRILRDDRLGGDSAVGRELIRLGEGEEARVGKLIHEARFVGQVARQNLFHEGFGVGHVAEAVGRHRVREEALIVEEVVDRRHLADVGLVVLRRVRDFRLGTDACKGFREVCRVALVEEIR